MVTEADIVLQVDGLRASFGSRARPVRAVDNVSFSIRAGQTVALVGESGCGKSATALSLARLLPEPPAFYEGGHVRLLGQDLLSLPEGELRKVRGSRLAYVFQEPASSLNPVIRIREQVAEALRLHRPGVPERAEVARLLRLVGIPNAEEKMHAYPHELSGGLQQRVMIAMALASQPRLLVADEPTTALDVTIQKQILDLLRDLQRQFGMAILLITHNLGLVAENAHDVHVMYAGRIVESGPVEQILRAPRHPYTRALLRAVPRIESSGSLEGIEGMVPRLSELPSGCAFHPRCPFAVDRCRAESPGWDGAAGDGVRCHVWRTIAQPAEVSRG